MEILDKQTASAILDGLADQDWVLNVSEEAIGWLKSPRLAAELLVADIKYEVQRIKNKIKDGWNFFTQWFRDDPVGASAGVGLGLACGVLLVGGAKVIGALVTGLSIRAVFTGLAKVALGTAANAILGNPIGACIRFLVRSAQFLYNFNWNATDKQYEEQQKEALKRLYSAAGTVMGTTVGGLACGFIGGVALVKLNVANLARLWEVAGDDLKDEIVASCNSLLAQSTNFVITSTFTEIYKNSRKAIKFFTGNGKALKPFLPNLAKGVEAWGEEGGKPWTFAKQVEEFVESIDDKNLQAFTETFIESAMDSCTEVLIGLSNA